MTDIPFGGRLRFFLPFWHTISHDKYAFDILKGFKLQFEEGPPPEQKSLPFELKMNDEECRFMDKEIEHLLHNKFIRKLSGRVSPGWVSNVFLVLKKTGGI